MAKLSPLRLWPESAQEGHLVRCGVPPGSYTAFAYYRDSKLDWEDPQVRQRFETYVKSVTLEASKDVGKSSQCT